VQLETKEPIDQGLAAFSQAAEDMMLPDTSIMAYRELGRVDKRYASTRAETAVYVDAQRNERGWEELHKARVADQVRKLTAQLGADVLGIKGFEGAIVTLMEQDQDGHNLRERKFSGAIAPFRAAGETLRVAFGFKGSTKVIDMTEEFEYTHG
jgi:hypothetical protein